MRREMNAVEGDKAEEEDMDWGWDQMKWNGGGNERTNKDSPK